MKTLKQEDLRMYTGSEQFYQHNVGRIKMVLTEGCHHVREAGEAYWLFDVILSHQTNPKVHNEEFQVWTLQKRKNDWLVTCDNGNGRIVAKQVIEYSDFPLDQIKLYYTGSTCMLPSEY